VTDDDWQKVAMSAAEHMQKTTGAPLAVVIFGDLSAHAAFFVGAHVPSKDTLKTLLRAVLKSLNDGTARVLDKRHD
jgi:hypothetical protein